MNVFADSENNTLATKVDSFITNYASELVATEAGKESLQLIKELTHAKQLADARISELSDAEKIHTQEFIFCQDIINSQPAGLYRIRVFSIDKWEGRSWANSDNPPYIMELANDRMCEIVGVDRDVFKKNPYIISDLVHQEDKQSFVISNTEANLKVIPYRWEGRLVVNDKIVWVRLESTPHVLENGDILWTGVLHDISERRLSEILLEETRLNLESVLEGANIGTLEWNVQTGEMKFNEIWARNLGYTLDEIRFALAIWGAKSWEIITHPDDIEYANNMLERHFAGEVPFHIVECRMMHRDGHWVWIRQVGKLKTRTPDGKPLLMYGTHIDISKNKADEEELRKNEEKYRLLFANNPQPMFIFKPETLAILEINQAFIDHYGYSKAELLSMKISDLKPVEDLNTVPYTIQKIQAGETNFGIRRHIKKNGDIIFVDVKSHLISYNSEIASHVLINDITDQRLAEQALVDLNDQLEERIELRTAELTRLNSTLQESELMLRTVSDFTYNWEYWKSPDNRIVFMSPSVREHTGYTVEEFEANPDLLDEIIHPSDREMWDAHQNERCTYSFDNKKLDLNFRIITKSGDIRWIAHICRCIIIEGKSLGIRVSNRDITEKINAENQLLGITVEVEERERKRFSSELHDGMGPLLSTIKLYFQWLADTDVPEKRKIIIEKGNHSIEMAIQTARELAHGLSSQYVTEEGYIRAISDFTQKINLTKKLKINFITNTNERFSGFLELMLYRITTELIKNTLSYAQAAEIDINFDFDRDKNLIIFKFSDNGIGFEWEEIKRAKKGLGLMNIEQRVRIMKGKIEINSSPEMGMNAIIQFPVE